MGELDEFLSDKTPSERTYPKHRDENANVDLPIPSTAYRQVKEHSLNIGTKTSCSPEPLCCGDDSSVKEHSLNIGTKTWFGFTSE